MRLESARNLKDEVLTEVLGVDPARRSRLAVGIAPGSSKGEYRIAIRVADANDTDHPIVRELVKRASHEADVKIMDRITVSDPPPHDHITQTLTVGSAVAHCRGLRGTLGFFARRVRDSAVGFVSCNHVIAAQDMGAEGDEIVRPRSRGESLPPEVIGYLDGHYARLKQRDVYVDCAFAQLADNIEYEPTRLGLKDVLKTSIATPIEPTFVGKIGSTTGRTRGRITAFDLDGVEIPYPFGIVALKAQIEIESVSDSPFSCPGDSGSLVFTDDHRPLGLLCATSRAGGAHNIGRAYANPINSVLNILGVEIVV